MIWAQGSDWAIMDSMGSNDSYCFLTWYYLCPKMTDTMNRNKLKIVQYRAPEYRAVGFGEERRERIYEPTANYSTPYNLVVTVITITITVKSTITLSLTFMSHLLCTYSISFNSHHNTLRWCPLLSLFYREVK